MRTVIFFALLAALAFAIDVECNGTVSDTKNKQSYAFDLSSLHHNDQTYIDSLFYRTDTSIYYVNFCGQTASACDTDDTSVCIRLPDGQDYKYLNGGSTTTQKISMAETGSPQNSVVVTYSDGDSCGTGGKYKTKIVINCQTTAVPGFFYSMDEDNECDATLYMYSAAGCGEIVPYVDPHEDDGSTDGGEIFAMVVLIVLAVGLVVYFAGGALYQWKVKEAQSFPEFSSTENSGAPFLLLLRMVSCSLATAARGVTTFLSKPILTSNHFFFLL